MNELHPIDAPRPNHSTGPNVVSTSSTKMPEGKKACRLKRRFHSSTNAFRHGLTGQLCVITPDEQQAYDKHSKITLDALAPAGDYERDLAQSSFPLFDQSIAERGFNSSTNDRWRLKRARTIEGSLLAIGMQHGVDNTGAPQVDDAFAQARTWIQEARNLQLLTIYEQRIQRSVDKKMAQLEAFQAKRQQAASNDMRQAKLLYQLAQAEGKPYQPEAFFTTAPAVRESVYSTPEIASQLSRESLIRDAGNYVYRGKLPRQAVAKASAGGTATGPSASETPETVEVKQPKPSESSQTPLESGTK